VQCIVSGKWKIVKVKGFSRGQREVKPEDLAGWQLRYDRQFINVYPTQIAAKQAAEEMRSNE
jgi:hypothetical protein